MDRIDVKNELADLVTDVKEMVAYLKELGVEHIDVEIHEFEGAVQKAAKIVAVSDEPAATIERFVPDFDFVKEEVLREEKPAVKTPQRRSRIFDSTKLSRAKNRNEQKTAKSIDKMPKESKLKESLYGDITESLPESDDTLESIRAEIGADCTRCVLCEKRTQVVNSVGDPEADLIFIGEAPGADEDAQGEPFVGRAGQLLTKIIEAIGFTREEVFIGNINRCRPPGNRQPQADEAEVCKPFLLREIGVVRPKVIVVMGNTACQNLLETKVGITKLRGTFKDYFGVKVMPTFHPAYLLRDPRKKREVWEDMKTVKAYLDQ